MIAQIRTSVVAIFLICVLAGCGGGASSSAGSSGTVSIAATPTPLPSPTANPLAKGTGAVSLSPAVLDTLPAVITGSPQSADGSAAARATASPLPSSFRLPAASVPPVLDQGYIGSCGAFAIGYGLTTYTINLASGGSPSNPSLQSSPTYMYAQACIQLGITKLTGTGPGTTFLNYADFLVGQGSQTDAAYPYPGQNVNNSPSAAETRPAIQLLIDNLPAADPTFQIGSYARVPTDDLDGSTSSNGIKEQLLEGRPVAIAVNEYSGQADWYNKPLTQVFTGSGFTGGGHWMFVLGYDDTIPWTSTSSSGVTTSGTGAFLLQNSWGTAFGANGLWYMSYPALAASITEAHVLFPISPRETPTDTGGPLLKPDATAAGNIIRTRQVFTQPAGGARVFMVFHCQLDQPRLISRVILQSPDNGTFVQDLHLVCRDSKLNFSRRDGFSFKAGTWRLSLETRDPKTPTGSTTIYSATVRVKAAQAVLPNDALPNPMYGPTGRPGQVTP